MRPRHLFYVLLLLPVFIFRDYTPTNELKYLSIAEEAIENNTWFTFYNQGKIYADKPPLYFWLIMIPRLITGEFHMWIMALFSLLPAAGVMAVMDKWFREEKVKHNPLASDILLATTLMFLGSALIIRMDMLMTFFITLSLYTFFKMYSGKAKPVHKWLLPLWIFMAVFSKGPIGVVVPVLSIIVFLVVKKDMRSIGKYLGWRQWLVMLGLAGIWFAMIYWEGGDEYLENLLVKQTVGRGVDAVKHREPFWFYLQNIVWMAAPWTLMYIAVAWKGIKEKVYARNDVRTFFFTVILTTLIMLSLFSSKLEVYMLPAFPFIVYICSAWLSRFEADKLVRVTVVVTAALFALVFPASFVIPRFVKFGYDSLLVIRMGMFLLFAGAVAAIWLVHKKHTSKGVAVLGGSLILMLSVSFFDIGQFNPEIGFGHYAKQARELAEREKINNYAYFHYYQAPNMNVYLGQRLYGIREIHELDSLDNLGYRTILFVRDKERRTVPGFAEWIADVPEAGRHSKYSWYVLGGRKQAGEDEDNGNGEE